MTTSIRRRIAMGAIALLAVLAALSASQSARACTALTIINNTGFDLELKFYDAGMNIFSVHAPPGTSTQPGPPAPFIALGILSNAGTPVPYPGGGGCTQCITLPGWKGGPPTCAILCPNAAACTMTLNPVLPCPPVPPAVCVP